MPSTKDKDKLNEDQAWNKYVKDEYGAVPAEYPDWTPQQREAEVQRRAQIKLGDYHRLKKLTAEQKANEKKFTEKNSKARKVVTGGIQYALEGKPGKGGHPPKFTGQAARMLNDPVGSRFGYDAGIAPGDRDQVRGFLDPYKHTLETVPRSREMKWAYLQKLYWALCNPEKAAALAAGDSSVTAPDFYSHTRPDRQIQNSGPPNTSISSSGTGSHRHEAAAPPELSFVAPGEKAPAAGSSGGSGGKGRGKSTGKRKDKGKEVAAADASQHREATPDPAGMNRKYAMYQQMRRELDEIRRSNLAVADASESTQQAWHAIRATGVDMADDTAIDMLLASMTEEDEHDEPPAREEQSGKHTSASKRKASSTTPEASSSRHRVHKSGGHHGSSGGHHGSSAAAAAPSSTPAPGAKTSYAYGIYSDGSKGAVSETAEEHKKRKEDRAKLQRYADESSTLAKVKDAKDLFKDTNKYATALPKTKTALHDFFGKYNKYLYSIPEWGWPGPPDSDQVVPEVTQAVFAYMAKHPFEASGPAAPSS